MERHRGTIRRPTVITQLNANDIILGRGQPSTGNEGNIRFRELIRALLPYYTATSKRAEKDRLARAVIDEIVRKRQGRFVRRVESPAEADSLELDSLEGVWILVDEKDVIPKVKQTFRDQHSESASSETGGGAKQQREPALPQAGFGVPSGTTFAGMLSPSLNFPFPFDARTAPRFPGLLNTTAGFNQIPLTYNSLTLTPQLALANQFQVPEQREVVPRNQLPNQTTERNETPDNNNTDSNNTDNNNHTQGLDILAQAAMHRQNESCCDHGDLYQTDSEELDPL